MATVRYPGNSDTCMEMESEKYRVVISSPWPGDVLFMVSYELKCDPLSKEAFNRLMRFVSDYTWDNFKSDRTVIPERVSGKLWARHVDVIKELGPTRGRFMVVTDHAEELARRATLLCFALLGEGEEVEEQLSSFRRRLATLLY